jgi:hypothetical protein
MKKILILFFSLFSLSSYANLYLQTEYREGKNPKVITKQHIFLEKRYTINYTKKSYVLTLKKVNEKEATIESETYSIDKMGHKTMEGGSVGTYKIGKSFTLVDRGPNGNVQYYIKFSLEKFVPTIP